MKGFEDNSGFTDHADHNHNEVVHKYNDNEKKKSDNGKYIGDNGQSGYATEMKNLPEDLQSDVELKKSNNSIMKNVVLISFAFLLLFTAFQSMAYLQSSINQMDGLGTYSLSAIYASLILSCLFLPACIIKSLTAKWTMVFSMLCYSTYIAAQFYPTFWTLIPAAMILGMGAAPMWSAKCTYLTQIAHHYSTIHNVPLEPIVVKFFGIFFLFFQTSTVIGNLISSQVLKPGEGSSDEEGGKTNHSHLETCGVNYCPSVKLSEEMLDTSTNFTQQIENDNFQVDKIRLYILSAVFLSCSLLSTITVACFVDPLSINISDGERSNSPQEMKKVAGKTSMESDNETSWITLFKATSRHMKKPYQILIIPLTFWSGVEQGFFGADFTAGYVSCAYGVHNIGKILMVYGATDAVCSFAFSFVIRRVGRLPIFLLGFCFNLLVIFILFQWSPDPDQYYMFFIISGMWGVSDAVWQTQINALYGVLFEKHEEAAYSNYRLWESFGFIFAYILQAQVCIHTKLIILIICLVIGMIGYCIIEFKEYTRKKDNQSP